MTPTDTHMMAVALRMAKRGLGATAPNPSVGAVIANESAGEVIARGWTQSGGRPHAETEAVGRAGTRARGATMYVTLEPCAHHGKTPPCVDAIIAAGLKRVVVGCGDPDPRTAGQGIARLRAAGITATEGVLAAEARWMALGHILRVTQQRPFVQVKMALAADGSVPRGGRGRANFVTGAEARARGHLLRAEADAILLGYRTILDDDPELTCRLPGLGHRSPDRVIIDSRLQTPVTAKALRTIDPKVRVWIASAVDEEMWDHSPLSKSGCLKLPAGSSRDGRVDLHAMLSALAANGITRLLVEGGPTVWQSFFDLNLVDEVVVFRAGAADMDRQPFVPPAFSLVDRRRIGEDVMLVLRRM